MSTEKLVFAQELGIAVDGKRPSDEVLRERIMGALNAGPRFMFRFWNTPHRLQRMSLHDRIREKHHVMTPGCIGDATDRGQPNRFAKWHKLPDAAHRLYWRTHGGMV